LADKRPQQQGSVLSRIHLRSPYRVLLVVALVALLAVTQGRFLTPICRAVHLSGELLCLRSEHQRLVEENEQLAEVATYLGTEDGQELAARSELGAVKEEERLIICRPNQPSAPPVPARLSQLVHRKLTRGYEVVHNAVGSATDLVGCLLGTGNTSQTAPADDETGKDVEP